MALRLHVRHTDFLTFRVSARTLIAPWIVYSSDHGGSSRWPCLLSNSLSLPISLANLSYFHVGTLRPKSLDLTSSYSSNSPKPKWASAL
jgi:hypothetical protein